MISPFLEAAGVEPASGGEFRLYGSVHVRPSRSYASLYRPDSPGGFCGRYVRVPIVRGSCLRRLWAAWIACQRRPPLSVCPLAGLYGAAAPSTLPGRLVASCFVLPRIRRAGWGGPAWPAVGMFGAGLLFRPRSQGGISPPISTCKLCNFARLGFFASRLFLSALLPWRHLYHKPQP